MKIVRGVSNGGFTRMPNAAARDKRLSFRARGVFAFLLSHVDDGWLSDATFLSQNGKEGRDACETALRELDQYGYIERKKRQLLTGRWTTEVTVYEAPKAASNGVAPVEKPGETAGGSEP